MEYLVSEKIKTDSSRFDHAQSDSPAKLDNTADEQIVEKINKSMRLGKWKLERANWRYPFYIVLLFLLVLIFIQTITNNR